MLKPNRQQWQLAADSMPQIICLVDHEGRVLHANRTLERWGLGQLEAIQGVTLHDALHRHCSDENCYLRLFWQDSLATLAQQGSADCNAWDPLLQRHLMIRCQIPIQEGALGSAGFHALVTIDDVTGLKTSGEHGQPREDAHMSDWVRTEEALRATQNELWRLSAQHLAIQESERRRIALDLHDGLGQTLSLVKLSIEAVVRAVNAGGSGNAAADLERLVPTVKSAMAELRNISMNLRPSTLDDLGILATLAWYFREFEAACPDMALEREISVAEADVPELLKITIFRIVQEAVSNALKHAGANRIRVCLGGQDGALALSIEDDGRGFDPAAAANGHEFGRGLGLQSMKERTELSGGDYEFSSAPGQGTRIRVRWPALANRERDRAAPLRSSSVHILDQTAPADDRELPERYSQCLACMRRLESS